MKKWHLWLAASIGLVVIAGMMIREFDLDAMSKIHLSPQFFAGTGIAVLLFAVQNLMYTLRFRYLCQRKLSLSQSFRINVLCEFTSAVTPSAVGGSGLAFVYLNREGVTMGRSIFTMFAALLADEAFLAISCCVLYLCVPSDLLFCTASDVGATVSSEWLKGGIHVVFLISTLIVAAWTAILYVLLLHRPQLLGWVLKACCKIPGLRRFQPKIERFSNDMTLASQEAKFEGSRFWLRLMGYTSVAWLARFAIVAAILFAFQCQGDVDDINTQPHARRQRRSRTDVPPLLRRLSARCLGSHTRSNALEGHLLLPIPRNGHHCAAQVDRKETVEVALLIYSAPHSFIVHRTQSDRTANATRSDGGRNLIGHRTRSDDLSAEIAGLYHTRKGTKCCDQNLRP